jgi:hypothetical protein
MSNNQKKRLAAEEHNRRYEAAKQERKERVERRAKEYSGGHRGKPRYSALMAALVGLALEQDTGGDR